MSRRKIEMYEYKAIIYRLRQGMTARQIAKEGFAGRHKINAIRILALQHGWLEEDSTFPDETTLAGMIEIKPHRLTQSLAEPYRDFIKQCVQDGVYASVIHQRLIEQFNFNGAYNCIQRFVKEIKDSDLSIMTVPLIFDVGEAAQVDFGKGPKLYDDRVGKEVDTWFFVMTLCWSRHQYAELITHQDVETWLRCHQNASAWFDGVVKKIIIDNAKCAITKACYYDPKVQRSYEAFAQEYGFIISACPPYDPQKKGRVEAGVKYLKKNFLPLRQFKGLQQANDELKKWVIITAGIRKHGSTFKKPLEEFNTIEKEKLNTLPAVLSEIAVWERVKLYRDCHVRYKYCSYSAPFDLYQEELWLKATPTTITIYHHHDCVAHHARLFEKGKSSTKEEHLPPKARYYLSRNVDWCLKQSELIGEHCALIIDDVIHHRSQDLLRQAQGILSLAEIYGKKSLENACQRAFTFNVYDYKTIKFILEKGLDETAIDLTIPDELTRKIYQGGARFQRPAQELLH